VPSPAQPAFVDIGTAPVRTSESAANVVASSLPRVTREEKVHWCAGGLVITSLIRSALAPPEELAHASVHYHPGTTAKGVPLHIRSADALLDTLDDLSWGHRPRCPHSGSAGGSALDSWRWRSSPCGAEEIRPVATYAHGAKGHVASWAHGTSRRTRRCWDAHRGGVSLETTSGANSASSGLHGHLPAHHAKRR